MRLLAHLRKSLYKHKLLGGVLGAQLRKSSLFAQKGGNSAPKPDFHQKAVLGAEMPIFAERLQKSRNASIFALKSCSDYPILLILGPLAQKDQNLVEFRRFGGISGNLMEIGRNC